MCLRIVFFTVGERRSSNEGSTEHQQPKIYLFHFLSAQRDERRMLQIYDLQLELSNPLIELLKALPLCQQNLLYPKK